jgi:hypothetical protein
MGVCHQDIARAEAALAGQGNEPVAVWPENAASVRAFLACATQWRTVSLGLAGSRVTGLDYASCKVILEGEKHVMDGDCWRNLRIMEAEALLVINGGAQ